MTFYNHVSPKCTAHLEVFPPVLALVKQEPVHMGKTRSQDEPKGSKRNLNMNQIQKCPNMGHLDSTCKNEHSEHVECQVIDLLQPQC